MELTRIIFNLFPSLPVIHRREILSKTRNTRDKNEPSTGMNIVLFYPEYSRSMPSILIRDKVNSSTTF